MPRRMSNGCTQIQLANQPILEGFEHALRQSGLSEHTIKAHVDNMRLFSRYLLLYASSLRRLDEATEGAVYDFLEDWFPRKALWASVTSMKVCLASFKKFFQWMGATGLVSPAIVEDVLWTLKEDRHFFLRKVAEEFRTEEPDDGQTTSASPCRARSAPDATSMRVRELWKATVGSLSCPAHSDDIPRVGPPHPGGTALPQPGGHMSSIADTAVVIQSSEQSVPSTPSWFGEVTLIAHYLKRLGVLSAIPQDAQRAVSLE